MSRELIQCKIPITFTNYENKNNVIIPKDVIESAINNAMNQPIIMGTKTSETVIGAIRDKGESVLWCEVEPEFIVNESHMEGIITVFDDITLCGVYLRV